MSQNLPEKYYREDFRAHLADTSCYGNVFYLIYHKWVATAKENFFLKKVEGFTNLLQQHGIKMLVFESSLKLFRELHLHDKVSVYIHCPILKKMKAHLKYILVDGEGQKIAEAENKLAFVDRGGKIIPIPEVVFQALETIRG
ncbi:hypothetical protein A3H38_02310 [candidate division WOR-1 bacterium RIFCSPLOWO2_02_FULL_46_20]|uniref:Thioesterase domain-containing protein n=2 Tax=Saganbacteria TaxID=1703751 RepID=A0A1F4R8M1_UNCSA|nr:MAG: hypothetical protein A3H38_02310 [candidate division WOR-1 bacterium RIFCSPLOWO2_02_FULL_46_20]OGC09338.1 MAG: hypothetical protein A3F86_00605 [candidate division WOR-1 bacterium RIFCSPLOWO2_12_FULL_45_9]